MSLSSPIVYEDKEFRDKETMGRFISMKRDVIFGLRISNAALYLALGVVIIDIFFHSMVLPYIGGVLIVLSVSTAILTSRLQSKAFRILQSDDVRYVEFDED